MGLLRWFLWVARQPDPNRDPCCAAETAWVRGYVPTKTSPGAFVLDHARRRYAESIEAFASLTAGASESLKLAGTLATIEVAAAVAFHIATPWSVRLSLCCLLAAMLAAMRSRRPLECPMQPRIRDVLEPISRVENPEAWLAASLHDAVEAQKVINEWKAVWLSISGWLICTGIACLLPIAFGR